MKNKVSIIVPVYNVQEYVLRCLESLRKQSYSNLEIIVVDDGSTDESGKVCDEFAKMEKRVKVFHKKNGGLSDARNFGIKKSSGDLIAFIDSDDYVSKNYIDKMIKVLEDNGSDIVICGYNKEQPIAEIASGFEATYNCLVRQDNVDIVAWNKLYKKKLFIENGIDFPVGKIHEDLLTTYKVASKAKKVSYLDEVLYFYTEREGSITDIEEVKEKLEMREKAASEAVKYFAGDDKLCDVAKVSLMLAKYAYIDAALKGQINESYYGKNIKWLRKNISKYKDNKYVTRKLRIYNRLSLLCGGLPYKLFRKVWHD